MNNDPELYFQKLQSIAIQQDKAKLTTLAVEFGSVLEHLPKVRTEIDRFLAPDQALDYTGLVSRIEPQLEQAAAFLSELDFLPADLQGEAQINDFIQTAKNSLSLRTLDGINERFQSLCQQVRQERQRLIEAKAKQIAKQKAAAKRKAEEQAKFKAAIPKMLVIPAGQFTMGCVKGRDNVEGGCYSNESPSHNVSVASFLLGKYPVTFTEFDAYCELSGSDKPSNTGWGRDRQPVVNVSWQDAQQYIHWLKEVTGKAWRLPCEAEWEYAARGGNNKNAFPWGQVADSNKANYGGALGRTTPVGQYPSNGLGLYDMHGNVWEWCQDNYHSDYKGAPDKAVVWAGGGGGRVLRGGSWLNVAGSLRSAIRYWNTPGSRINRYGFRLAQGQV